MRIKIAQKYRPFSHNAGETCLIPKSGWKVQIFPTRLLFTSLLIDSKTSSFTVDLGLEGPMREFTVEQDLEKGRVAVFAHTRKGYMRYFIQREKEGITLFWETPLPSGVVCELHEPHKKESFRKKGAFLIPIPLEHVEIAPPSLGGYGFFAVGSNWERLALGMSKMLDWTRVAPRQDLREILPVWHALAQLTPDLFPEKKEKSSFGTMALLEKCALCIQKQMKNEIVPSFLQVFQAAFEGILVPRLEDTQFQGLVSQGSEELCALSPLSLVTQGAQLIRSLFFQEKEQGIFLLPCLPPQFNVGRMVNVLTSHGDLIHLEWSKKLLKKVVWRASSSILASNVRTPVLQKAIKSFRLRRQGEAFEKPGEVYKSGQSFVLDPGEEVSLDLFQK